MSQKFGQLLRGEGQTYVEVPEAIGVMQSLISGIWNLFLETRIKKRRQGQGLRRATTLNEFFLLTIPVFLFIPSVGIFLSGGNVALETIMCSCRKLSDLLIEK